jgi:glycosyltransferase involved in cell wall biosynthesis
MVAYSFYESDNRVIRYAEALAQRGDSVEVLALGSGRGQPSAERIGQVHVSRIQNRAQKGEKSKMGFLLPLIRFWLLSSMHLAWRHLKNRYDVIHVHNVPDFLVFAAWLPKWTGAKVILDIHDIVPEFYASKFSLSPDSFGVKMLKKVERASTWFSDRVIVSNHLWLETFASRTGAHEKCSVFINNVDTNTFQPRPRKRNDGKLLVIFPGGLQRHQGLDIALHAFQKLIHKLPHVEFHIYGDGNMKASLLQLTAELGLEDKVRFFKPVPVHQIADAMANADLGVVPKRADSFGNEAYSTKIMEFMSLGIPVVVSNTKVDRYYFNDSVVRFFESGSPDALAYAMLEALSDQNLRQQMVDRAFEYVSRNSWDTCKQKYLDLVDSLVCSEFPLKSSESSQTPLYPVASPAPEREREPMARARE